MNPIRTLYKAKNLQDGTEIMGTNKEVAAALNVVPTTINKYALNGHLVDGIWDIKKAGQIKEDSETKFEKDWNEAVAPFRELSKRRKERKCHY